jgi:ABC-type uncharacterized transport system fused permease/ATPase subunit
LLQNILYPISLEYILELILESRGIPCDKTAYEIVSNIRLELIESMTDMLSQFGLLSCLDLELSSSQSTSLNIKGTSFLEPVVNWPRILSFGEQQLVGVVRSISKSPVLVRFKYSFIRVLRSLYILLIFMKFLDDC